MPMIPDIELEASDGCKEQDAADQLRDYIFSLSGEAFEKGDRVRDAIDTREKTEQRKEYVKKSFLQSIGGLPEGNGIKIAVSRGRESFPRFRIEKLLLQPREKVWITANLYLPDGKGPFPAILFVCGHDREGKQSDQYQRACRRLVYAGFAVLSMDSAGQGERAEYCDPETGMEQVGSCTREHNYAGFQCLMLGDCLARYMLHDCMAALDYLCARDDIDADRIGMTGNSGGGTLTMMMMMTDSRLKAAAPGTFVTSRSAFLTTGQCQDSEQIWRGLSSAGIDHEDGILCMAPRPVLILAARHDFFPFQGTVKTFERCRKYWEIYQAGNRLELFCDDSGHEYSAAMADRAADFFAEHLAGTGGAKEGGCVAKTDPSDGKILWCTSGGRIRTEFPDAKGIYEENMERFRRIQREKEAQPEEKRKHLAKRFLQDAVSSNRRPAPLYPRRIRKSCMVLDLVCDSIIWNTQEGMINHGYLFSRPGHGKEKLPVTIALWRDGCRSLQSHFEFIRKSCRNGRGVLVLDISGVGMVEQRELQGWTRREQFDGSRYKLNSDLLWLNDSLMGLGIYDVIRCVDMIGEYPGLDSEDIHIYSAGRYSAYARIAAFLDSRITSREERGALYTCEDMITDRFYDPFDISAFVLPGLVRYTDLDEIEKWWLSTQEGRGKRKNEGCFL